MSRTIKFRCYYKRDKKYVPLTGISLETNEVIVYQELDQIIPIDDVILEQFIERVDEYGRDIYDGDIAKDLHGNVGTFVYHQGVPCFKIGYMFLERNDINFRRIEVIGNIHDNKDLL